jgi:hypothetical protein
VSRIGFDQLESEQLRDRRRRQAAVADRAQEFEAG